MTNSDPLLEQRLGLTGVSAKPLRGVKVLVVEDDPFVALDIMKMLSQAGAEIIGPAMSVERAVELAEKEHIDCAVLDIRLGDQLVFPAAAVLRRRGVNIVFYTAQADPEALSRNWPGAKVLSKPAASRMLVQALAEACAQRGPAKGS